MRAQKTADTFLCGRLACGEPLFESGSSCLAHRKRTLGSFPATVGFSSPGWRTTILRWGYSECWLKNKPTPPKGQEPRLVMTHEAKLAFFG